MTSSRLENWDRFSCHMRRYIQKSTLEKYAAESGTATDLMSITGSPQVCVWNVLKYALRIWNGRMKEHDLEKIAHYAEMCWTMSGGKPLEKNDFERFKTRLSQRKAMNES